MVGPLSTETDAKAKQVGSYSIVFFLPCTKLRQRLAVENLIRLHPLPVICHFSHIGRAHYLYWSIWSHFQMTDSIQKALVWALAPRPARCLSSDKACRLANMQFTHM